MTEGISVHRKHMHTLLTEIAIKHFQGKIVIS